MMNIKKTIAAPNVIVAILCFLSDANASDTVIVAPVPENREWSFSLIFGMHRPNLDAMNNGIFKTPAYGYSEEIIDSATGNTESRLFVFDKPLPASPIGAKAAFELHWHPNTAHTLVLGIASWEKSSSVVQSGEIYTQGLLNEVNLRRHASLSYTEYNLGWRYRYATRNKFSFYTRTSIHQFFDIDYREEFIFDYISGSDLAGFQRIAILPAQTASMFLLHLGLGTEWTFQSWFSMDVEAGYFLGVSQAELSYGFINSDFQGADKVNFPLHVTRLNDGKLAYQDPNSTPESPVYKRMPLDFNGWQILLRMNFFY